NQSPLTESGDLGYTTFGRRNKTNLRSGGLLALSFSNKFKVSTPNCHFEVFAKINSISGNPSFGFGFGMIDAITNLNGIQYRSDGSIFVHNGITITGGLQRAANA